MSVAGAELLGFDQGAERLHDVLSAVERPVFLVGAERSGTTMLRLMLDHHPEIAWLNEFEYAVDLVGDDGGGPAPDDYAAWLETHRVFRATGLAVNTSVPYPSIVRSFLAQRLVNDGASLVGATVHRRFDRLLDLWPDARFIHILRDGRDVARSSIKIGWAGNVWTGASGWIEAERLWEELRPRLSEDRWTEIRYESLVAAPEPALESICSFLGLAYDPAMLEYDRSTTYDRPDARLTSQWKRKLGERDLALLEARIGPMLRARGYEPSGVDAADVGPAQVRRLRRQDRWARRLFNVRRYGLPLWLASAAARRIGPASWRRAVQRRMNQVDEKHLK